MKTRFLILSIALAALCVVTHAQTVSPFMGLGTAQFFDNNGVTLTSGVLYSYFAGTGLQQATFTDATGLTLNPNPLPFGSGARVSIWLTPTTYYKFVLCLQNDGPNCAPADVLFTEDQVPGSPRLISIGSTFTGTFISGSPNPASSGILRLASADAICWRNTANTANLCITKDANDVLEWSGGTIKFPEVSCSGNSASFDYLCADSSTHHWKFTGNGGPQTIIPGIGAAGVAGDLVMLAANGIDISDSNVSATNPSFNSVIINGVTYNAPPTVIGQCEVATTLTATGFQTCPYSFNPPQRVTLSSNVSVPNLTQTTIMTETVTFPSTPAGNNFRAQISYVVWTLQGPNICNVEAIDTTNGIPYAAAGRDSNGTGYEGIAGAEVSTHLYAAGGTAIFALSIECNASGGATVYPNMTNGAIFTMSPAEPTYLSVTPVLSN